jgi:hypothetical protein
MVSCVSARFPPLLCPIRPTFARFSSPSNGANGKNDIEGKVARETMSEWSRGDASDIDGKTERSKWAGAHESMWAMSEFQSKRLG